MNIPQPIVIMARQYGMSPEALMQLVERGARDSVFWVESVSGKPLWEKQREVHLSVKENRVTCVPACNASGKSFAGAGLVAYGVNNLIPFLGITSAPTERQVKHVLWKEIRDFYAASRIPLAGTPDLLQLIVSERQRALGFATGDYNPNLFQGMRESNNTWIILDESCHDDQTEVMTEDGWKRFADVKQGEKLLTMDPATLASEYRRPTRLIEKRHVGKMIEYAPRKGGNFCVTPDHEMWARIQHAAYKRRPMRDIAGIDGVYMRKSIVWKAEDVETIEIPTTPGRFGWPARQLDADAWMGLLGWYCSEGNLQRQANGQPCSVGITQKDPEVLEEIAQLWRKLGFDPRTYPANNQVQVHDGQMARHLFEACGGDGRQLTRGVPTYVRMASARQIGLFLDTYSRGDGYVNRNREIIYTSSRRMADHLQEMILKTGMPSVIIPRALAGRQSTFPDGHVATSTMDGFVVTRPFRASETKVSPGALREIDYDGYVYCATVPPHHLLFTRRNGYSLWSGNCGIAGPVFEGALGIMGAGTARLILFGNPVDPLTQFREMCESPHNHTIRICAYDMPNFNIPGRELREHNFVVAESNPDHWTHRLGPYYDRNHRCSVNLPTPYLTTPEFVESIVRMYGTASPQYVARVLGLFPEQSDEALFTLTELDDAMDPESERRAALIARSAQSPLELGVDVARSGSNMTVVVGYQDPYLQVLGAWAKRDTEETADRVVQIAERCARAGAPPLAVKVDVIGVGGGVVDKLRRRRAPWSIGAQQFPVVEFNSNSTENVRPDAVNARGHAYLDFKDRLEERALALPAKHSSAHADQLRKELLSIRKSNPDGKEQTVVMGKEFMKSHGIPSPDFADAAVIAAYRGPRPRGDYGISF